MAIQQVRGVATVSLTGILAIELQSRYKQVARLRETLTTTAADGTKTTADVGFYSFRPYDTSVVPAGNGFLLHMFDRPNGTLMATGTGTQRGVRATIELTMSSVPTTLATLAIDYPDMSDETAAFSLLTQTYTFSTASPLGAGNLVLIGANVADTLDNLVMAINGSADYGSAAVGTDSAACLELTARRTSTSTVSIEARQGGTWGNRVTVTASSSPASNITETDSTAGTGNHGVDLIFEASALPGTLLTGVDTSQSVHVELFGVDDYDYPHKILQAPAQIYGSSTVAPT